MAVKLSANLGFLWPDRPLLERIDAAARAGFPAVELHWPYDVPAAAVRARCERHRIKLLGINTHPGDMTAGDFGLGAVPGREAEFEAAMDEAIRYARAAGASMIHAMAGVVPPGGQEAARRRFIANLKKAAPKAADHGLILLLEAINPFDRPGYFYARQSEAAMILAAVGAPNLKLMFDAYHCGRAEGDAAGLFEAVRPLVGHVQIAAVPDRGEPDRGDLDHRAFFAALDRLGWDGYVGCEYKPRGDTDEGLVWRRNLGLAEA